VRSRFVVASLAVHGVLLAVAGAMGAAPLRPATSAAALEVRLAVRAPTPPPQALSTGSTPAAGRRAPPAAEPPPAGPTAVAHAPSPSAPAPLPARRTASPTPKPASTDRSTAVDRPDSAAGAPPAPTPAERANHLRSAVLALLAPTLTYPPLARKYGWQGRVLVDVEMAADGRIQPLRIADSSGYRILDHHAFDALERIGAVPQARQWLGGHGFAFAVPVTYRLIDG